MVLISAGLKDLAESRVEVSQKCDQHEARGYVFWMYMHDAVDVTEVRVLDGFVRR